ncbi:MAG: hypothetical protein R3E88_06855 [Myxococcota bacterium]|nr:hypothetical protein [Myxococcales bacterium]
MAQSNRMSAQKRLREKKKAEAAEQKRLDRSQKKSSDAAGGTVAERDELEGYGVLHGPLDDTGND